MSTYDPDPLKWSPPKNDADSCYVDSALWAVFNKENNGFYQLINSFNDTKIEASFNRDKQLIGNIEENGTIVERDVILQKTGDECNLQSYTDLNKNLLGFYNNIHIKNKIDVVTANVTAIRKSFDDCKISTLDRSDLLNKKYTKSKENWVKGQEDASEFLSMLINKYSSNTNNIEYQQESEYTFFNYISGKKETSIINKHSNPVVYFNINLGNIDWNNIIMVSDNNLRITVNLETFINNKKNYVDLNKLANTTINTKEYPDSISKKNGQVTYYIETKQIIANFKTIDKTSINIIIFPITRMIIDINGDIIKDTSTADFPLKIGNLVLSSIVVHSGQHYNKGHYFCYFRVGNKWFLMNDTSRVISDVNDEIYNVTGLLSNCSILVYTQGTQEEIRDTSDKKALELFNAGGGTLVQNLRSEFETSSSAPISSASSPLFTSRNPLGSSSSSGQTPYKDTLNVSPNQSNICEKYGDEWLNLFVSSNATSGAITYNGVLLRSVNVPQNCTFVPSGASSGASSPGSFSPSQTLALVPSGSSPGASPVVAAPVVVATGSPVVAAKTAATDRYYIDSRGEVALINLTNKKHVKGPELTKDQADTEKARRDAEKQAAAALKLQNESNAAAAKQQETIALQLSANQALETAKTKYSGNQEIMKELNKISVVDQNNILKNNTSSGLTSKTIGTIVYYTVKNTLYMVVNVNIQTQKKITRANKFLNLSNDTICNADFTAINPTPKYNLSGGTRKRNRNINGGTRKRKINLRRTRKLKLNKRRTRKV